MFHKKTLSALVSGSLVLGISSVAPATFAAAELDPSTCQAVSSRAEVEKSLAMGVDPKEISQAYADCYPQKDIAIKPPNQSFTVFQNNTSFEELKHCGYHPQRRELVCVVEVKQRKGYGGPAPQHITWGNGTWRYPGSIEWVRFCVNYPATRSPSTNNPMTNQPPYYPPSWHNVGLSGVRVHDEIQGDNGKWYYGVVIQADQKLHQILLEGHTFWARAALSWGSPSPNKAYCPPGLWGNTLQFKIKLDQ